MQEQPRNRNVIRAILENSNLSARGVRSGYYETGVFAGASLWSGFIRIGLMALSIGFLVAGIIFFFAYNWQDLHKFAKLGIVAGLIVLAVSLVLFSKLNEGIKNMLLTGASLLVGGLFAVFGQVYQTGANAYDFFLGWTVFVALWALVSNFPPLWLVLLALINTTILLYAEQVAFGWSETDICCLLFALNAAVVLLIEVLSDQGFLAHRPSWFIKTVAFVAIGWVTIGLIRGVFETKGNIWYFSLILAALFFTWGILQGLRRRRLFYLSLMPMAVIIIIASMLIRAGENELIGMFFGVGLFILISTTLVIRQILQLNKQWYGREQAEPPAATSGGDGGTGL